MDKYDNMVFEVRRYLEDNYNEPELKENVLNDRDQFEAELKDALQIGDDEVLSEAVADVLDELDMKYFYDAE